MLDGRVRQSESIPNSVYSFHSARSNLCLVPSIPAILSVQEAFDAYAKITICLRWIFPHFEVSMSAYLASDLMEINAIWKFLIPGYLQDQALVALLAYLGLASWFCRERQSNFLFCLLALGNSNAISLYDIESEMFQVRCIRYSCFQEKFEHIPYSENTSFRIIYILIVLYMHL